MTVKLNTYCTQFGNLHLRLGSDGKILLQLFLKNRIGGSGLDLSVSG